MSDITAFETLVASESEHKIAQQAAADKLAAAIYDVREQYGAHLLCAKTKDEFNDRLALCKDDMMKTVNAHLMPVTGVMRKVCKTMEREWRERTAADAVNPTSPGAPMNDMGLADGMAQAQTGTGAYGPGIPDDSMGGGIQGPGMTNTGQPFVASRDLFAYTPEELDAYGQQSNDQEAPHPKATHAADPHGEWTGASGGKEGRRRRADTTHPVQDIDPTYHPSDGPLIPEGDFHGYLDSVSQNGYDNPHTPNNDFTPGGDSGKQARRRQSNEMMGYPAQPGGGGMPDASGTATPGTAAPAMTPAPPGTAGSSPEMVTAAIIKRYAQWCVANLARPSVKTLEYYAANRSDLDYFVLTAALQRRADSYTNTNYPVDEGDPVIPGSGSNPGLGGPLGGAVHPYNDADFAPKQGSRHTAGSKDYLQQADEAITKLLNEKAEEFQESITPLQQALQTIQYAQQVQQAQQPMNVMPPAGTVNVLPQGQDPQAPPQGMDPAALAGMVSAGQGGGDPTQQDGQDGPPPAAADQGAIPPDMAQQIQAYRRRIARGDIKRVDDEVDEDGFITNPGYSEWKCEGCNAPVRSYRGEGDTACDRCHAQYNAFGQRLRDDWQDNESNYDDDMGDMEGYERSFHDARRRYYASDDDYRAGGGAGGDWERWQRMVDYEPEHNHNTKGSPEREHGGDHGGRGMSQEHPRGRQGSRRHAGTPRPNLVDKIMQYEGEGMAPDEEADFFQELLDSGVINGLQGSYGRRAQELLNQGIISDPSGENPDDVASRRRGSRLGKGGNRRVAGDDQHKWPLPIWDKAMKKWQDAANNSHADLYGPTWGELKEDVKSHLPHKGSRRRVAKGNSGGECGTEGCSNDARFIPISEGNKGSRVYRCTDCCDRIAGDHKTSGSRYFNDEGEPLMSGEQARFEDYLDQESAADRAYDDHYDDDYGPDYDDYDDYDEGDDYDDDGDDDSSEEGDTDTDYHDDKEWMDFRAGRKRGGRPKG